MDKLLFLLGGAVAGYFGAYLVASSRGQPNAVSLLGPTYPVGVVAPGYTGVLPQSYSTTPVIGGPVVNPATNPLLNPLAPITPTVGVGGYAPTYQQTFPAYGAR